MRRWLIWLMLLSFALAQATELPRHQRGKGKMRYTGERTTQG